MRDTELYRQILGIVAPWEVEEVRVDLPSNLVEVRVVHRGPVACSECGVDTARYDFRQRRWRHLDTCQLRTELVADVPRTKCETHGVHQVKVPWGEAGSRFTALFEALVVDWLLAVEAIKPVAARLGLTWDEVDGIRNRAVARGLARRPKQSPRKIGVDETSFQKRHEYVTVVMNSETGRVIHVADGRGRDSLEGFYDNLGSAVRRICRVTMDMHAPYIEATFRFVKGAATKIAFDKFHVAQLLDRAVDQVRRREARALRREGDETLKGTRYLFLENPAHQSRESWNRLQQIRKITTLAVGRAWGLKEEAMALWRFRSEWGLQRGYSEWKAWADRCRIPEIRKVAATLARHWWGIKNAVLSGATSAGSEALNAGIQRIKRSAAGFRNRRRFADAIYFHFGGLDLYPEELRSIHTKA